MIKEKYQMANPLCKPIKSALVKIYGAKNVRVANGRGTAWGWVEIGVTVPETSRELQNLKRDEVEKQAIDALKEAGLRPYTYCSDDGFASDSNCILVSIHFEKVAK